MPSVKFDSPLAAERTAKTRLLPPHGLFGTAAAETVMTQNRDPNTTGPRP